MRKKKFVDRSSFCDGEAYAEALAKGVGGPDPDEISCNGPFSFGTGYYAEVMKATYGASSAEFCAAAMHEVAAEQKSKPGIFVRKFGKRRSAPKKPSSRSKKAEAEKKS